MPTLPAGVWQVIMWVVLALIAVFLFQNIVLPLAHLVMR